MADAPSQIEYHPIVTELLKDREPPSGRIEMIGYFGPSKQADKVRLYQDFSLSSYYEVPLAAIELVSKVDPTDPNSATRLFVDAKTPLEHVQIEQSADEAAFIGGKIASAFLSGAEATVKAKGGHFILRSNPPRKCRP